MTSKTKKKTGSALWGGRFSTTAANSLQEFSQSVSFDWRLASYDITGSMAHARMLRRIGLLSARELKEILKGLEEISKDEDLSKFIL